MPRQLDPYAPIRPPAVRGALRAWFRAAAASVLRPVNNSESAKSAMVAALHDVETKVFGSTDRASSFAVLPIALDSKFVKEEPIPDPRQSPGLRYLGYGIFDNAPERVGFVQEDATFELKLKIRREFDDLEPLLVATVWLWTHFGGLGARVRRGFGSLELREADLDVFPEKERPVLLPRSARSLIDDALIRGLDAVAELFAERLPRLTRHPVNAGGAHPHVSLRTIDGIQFVNVMSLGTRNGRDTLERAGRIFREYRSTLERKKLGLPPLPDYFSVKQALERETVAHDVMRAAFGLPLSFYFRSLGGKKTTFTPQPPDKSNKHERAGGRNEPARLPSPLHFRVHRVYDDGQTPRPVVTMLNLAQGEQSDVLLGCRIVQAKQPGYVKVNPSSAILDDAIEWMCNRAQTLYGAST